jgi:hypothetical protein
MSRELLARIAELEAHERERVANAGAQYSEAWNAYGQLMKRMGEAAGVHLPPDLRYYVYINQIIARIEEFQVALTEIADDACDEGGDCRERHDRRSWCGVCIARAVLTKDRGNG